MNYNKNQLGLELKKQLRHGCNVWKISRWAYGIFFDHRDRLTLEIKEILKDLARMEDDPQFEYSEAELNLLAEMLINNEEDILKKINKINLDEQDHAEGY